MRTVIDTHHPDFVAGLSFSDGVARRFGASQSDVLDALSYLPDNILDLLGSPEGWTALAEIVRADLCLGGGVVFMPTVH